MSFKIIEEVGLNPNNFDKNRLLKQIELYSSWRDNCRAKGLIICCTGFGKTFCLILAILRMNRFAPSNFTNVIVPSTSLKDAWSGVDGHINTFNLKNVRVFVVNTYTMSDLSEEERTCHLLGLDECHHYANDDNKYFHQVLEKTKDAKAIMALSATLTSKEIGFFGNYDINVAGIVTEKEAEAKGFISKSVVFNLPVYLSEEEKIAYSKINSTFNSNFAKFNHNWNLVQACRVGKDVKTYVKIEGKDLLKTGKEWQEFWAKQTGWEIEEVTRAAQLFGWALQARQDFLHNLPSKVEVTKKIIEKFNVPTIIFSETIEFANKVAESLGPRARAYHSKLKTEIRDGKKFGLIKLKRETMKLFSKGLINVLSTAKALNEGFNVNNIELAIIGSGKKVVREDIQRKGRAIRFVEGKTAIIVNLYVEDFTLNGKLVKSQDKKWLLGRQMGSRVLWIKSINEISTSNTIQKVSLFGSNYKSVSSSS